MEKQDFIKAYKKQFIAKNKFKIVFEMGALLKGKERVGQVTNRFKEIADFIFEQKELWVLLILWDVERGTKNDLAKCGFEENAATHSYKGKIEDGLLANSRFDSQAIKESEIKYLKYEKFSFDKISPIVRAIAGYELGFENSANISAYFLSFEDTAVLLNLYDDRGMELLNDASEFTSEISNKFQRYLMK
ncbi:MAG: hypothetical protein Q8M29_03120 [Bacteroidota bacterium]|nr:hypothetical protein [Bacteroidota bacterium]